MWLQSLSDRQCRALLGLAHNTVVSDGLLDPNEELMMEQFKREMDLADGVEPDYIDLDTIEGVFDTRRAQRIALINLIHLSYADGAFEIEEQCLLRDLADRFGVEDAEFALLENWVKRLTQLEAEGRGLL
ncbi:MAG: TerB family tellurite resistance protein [Pseudomonadales bacterium]|jgi:tellurite resistance protein|nr:TerB family tellurite resistance protein [Pseudomonadales bacterium]